jgi:hypothetical protein
MTQMLGFVRLLKTEGNTGGIFEVLKIFTNSMIKSKIASRVRNPGSVVLALCAGKPSLLSRKSRMVTMEGGPVPIERNRRRGQGGCFRAPGRIPDHR